ncbi:Uu.00g075180.m01.CDS01 [Anthostomella pinea]|uniref:Uu.00g075180.m01.CDS01 n=1 Tax=Anthostomella pinea TaxID=933095 RepID=A0AAI8VWU2_9PEZI|nr:Uu.00g075180.m01.CDS01 [Anthostomella pinea]
MATTEDLEKGRITDTVGSFLATIVDSEKRSTEAHKYFLQDCHCVLSKPDGLVISTVKDHLNSPGTTKPISASAGSVSTETLREPAQAVWVAGDLAAVWTGSRLMKDGNEVKSSVMLLSLLKVKDDWKICGVAETLWEAGTPTPSLSSNLTETPGLMAPIDALLSAFSKPDWPALSQWFLDGGASLQSRPPAEYQVTNLEQSIVRLQGILDQLPPGTTFEEKLHDIEARTCGDLGFVWAPFVIEAGGRKSHEGFNIFSLLKRDDRWVISGCQNIGEPLKSAA